MSSATLHTHAPSYALLTQAELADFARSVARDTALWRSRLRYDGDARWSTRLFATPYVDVWLITWTRDQSTDLHDHGTSSGAFAVVEGTLEETLVVDRTASRIVTSD